MNTNANYQYQELVLNKPASGVNQALKEALLALRKAAEAVDWATILKSMGTILNRKGSQNR